MKNKDNFTIIKQWNDGITIRYGINDIIKMGHVYFYKDQNVLKCQSYFDFNITNEVLKELILFIKKGEVIRFSYINEGYLLNQLKELCRTNNFKLKIMDEWDAPQLELGKSKDIGQYLRFNKNSQIRKNYKKYEKNISNYDVKNNNKENIEKLWKDVLNIDVNSWKGQSQFDMQSLGREDLQYWGYLNQNSNNISLKVIYKNDAPLSYSLMFRKKLGSKWFAVKWGASYAGREEYAGIYCLFNHLEELYREKYFLKLDFWGRRNQTYDFLKNKHVKRYHIEILK